MVNKRVVVILIIVALILAITAITVTYSSSNSEKKLPLENKLDTSSGKVGVTILPPTVEDKGNSSQ